MIRDAGPVLDPATITEPVARALRAFADTTGADRLALAAIQRSLPGYFAWKMLISSLSMT